MQWNTQQLKDALEKATGLTAEIEEAGGDYDTESILLSHAGNKKDYLRVEGYNPEKAVEDASNWEVTHVVLRNQQSDSRGGVRTKDPVLAAATAAIRIVFEKLGIEDLHDHYHEFM